MKDSPERVLAVAVAFGEMADARIRELEHRLVTERDSIRRQVVALRVYAFSKSELYEAVMAIIENTQSSADLATPAQWQPIESAPKDGTPVLILYDSGAAVKCRWEDVDWNEVRDVTAWDWVAVGCIFETRGKAIGWLPSPLVVPTACRTKEFDGDYRRQPKTDNYCTYCQKDIKQDSPVRIVYLVDHMIVHPVDLGLYHGAGNPEGFIVGLDCAKTIGMEWSEVVPTKE